MYPNLCTRTIGCNCKSSGGVPAKNGKLVFCRSKLYDGNLVCDCGRIMPLILHPDPERLLLQT